MKYYRVINLKNGKECCLRNGMENDGQAVLDNFNQTHGETDYLLSYPDENTFDVEKKRQYLKEKQDSQNEIEIVAIIDDTVVGTAGIQAIGSRYKVRHRAEYGISIAKEYWGLGILKLRKDTIRINFPLYCTKCKGESLIDAKKFIVKEARR